MIKEEQLSQKEILGKAFIDIKKDVTAADRKAYCDEHDATEQLIVFYLKGDVKDADRGVQMLEFFSKRISDRTKKIENAKAL